MYQRCNVNLDSEFVKEVDNFADMLCISRSALITLSLRQYINSYRSAHYLPEMARALERIANCAEEGTISEDELRSFEILADKLSKAFENSVANSEKIEDTTD